LGADPWLPQISQVYGPKAVAGGSYGWYSRYVRTLATAGSGYMNAKQSILFGLGFLMVALGTAGIFLPLLPTTPFLLLAAYLFARSSDRWHTWLLAHRYFGPYLHAFRNKTGLTTTQKLRIGCSFSAVIAISFYFAPLVMVKAFLAVIWVFWMIMVLRVKTAADP